MKPYRDLQRTCVRFCFMRMLIRSRAVYADSLANGMDFFGRNQEP